MLVLISAWTILTPRGDPYDIPMFVGVREEGDTIAVYVVNCRGGELSGASLKTESFGLPLWDAVGYDDGLQAVERGEMYRIEIGVAPPGTTEEVPLEASPLRNPVRVVVSASNRSGIHTFDPAELSTTDVDTSKGSMSLERFERLGNTC